MKVKRQAGKAWMQMRRRVLRAEPLCRICKAGGRVVVATEVDHIKPLHKGGAEFDPDNLRPLCRGCHYEVTMQQQGKVAAPEIGLDGWPKIGQGADGV